MVPIGHNELGATQAPAVYGAHWMDKLQDMWMKLVRSQEDEDHFW